MNSKKQEIIGSSPLNTRESLERTVVLIKPGFTKLPNIEAKVVNNILSNEDIKLINKTNGKMTKEQASIFYIDKQNKSFYQELVDYMSSDDIVAFIFESNDAIKKVRTIVEQLRIELKNYYSIQDDVMKNILHATNTKLVDGILSKEDAAREIQIIENIQGDR